MFDDDTDYSEADSVEEAPVSRASREEQRRRNALARHKLELLNERKRLRAQITEVWEEAEGSSVFPKRLYNSRQLQEVKDVTVRY